MTTQIVTKDGTKINVLDEPDMNDEIIQTAKETRCDDYKFEIGGSGPRCYYENSSKEELVLEHVLEYQR